MCEINLSTVPHRWSPCSTLAEHNLEKEKRGGGGGGRKGEGERGGDKKGVEEKRKRSFKRSPLRKLLSA